MGREKVDERESFVLEWQHPIYVYISRMVGGSDEAADLTQDVFAAALRNWSQVPRDAVRPWIYRVATNAVYKRSRTERRRREREGERARMSDDRGGDSAGSELEDALENREQREILQRHLDDLPPDQRSLLLLHFFGGLSHHEVARTLEIPRTTVTSRIRGALDKLKTSLRRSGHIALLPHVDSFLATAPPLSVPAELSHSLLSLAAQGATATTTSSLIVGGAAMGKLIAVVGTAVVAVVVIVVLGRGGDSERLQVERETMMEQLAAEQLRVRDLSDANARLEAELEQAKALAARHEEAARRARSDALERASGPADGGGIRPAVEGPGGLDWESLAKLTRENRDIVISLAEAIQSGRGASALSPEQQARHRAMTAELEKFAALAKLESAYPMLDEAMLPEIMKVYVGSMLDLDEVQIESVARLATELQRDYAVPEDATPLMAHPRRIALLEEIAAQLDPYLRPEQRDTWDAVQPLWNEITQGSRGELQLGFRTSRVDHQIRKYFGEHYRLNDDQRVQVDPIIERYVADARTLLADFDQIGENKRALSDEEKHQLDEAQYALQRRIEDEVLPLLTDEQFNNLRTQFPIHFRFNDSGSTNISMSDNAGF